MPTDATITTGEAARQLGVSPETIRRWITSGQLPAVRLPSGHHRIRQADITQATNGTNGEPK